MSDSERQVTHSEPVVSAPDETKAADTVEVAPDQVNDDTPGVDDSTPSENPEENES